MGSLPLPPFNSVVASLTAGVAGLTLYFYMKKVAKLARYFDFQSFSYFNQLPILRGLVTRSNRS